MNVLQDRYDSVVEEDGCGSQWIGWMEHQFELASSLARLANIGGVPNQERLAAATCRFQCNRAHQQDCQSRYFW